MRDGSGFLRQAARVGSGLLVLALAGFLLGSCGGNALATRTEVTATRTAPSLTRPTVEVPTRTIPTETEAPPSETLPPATAPETTEPGPVTTEEAPPPTTAPPETTTVVETETVEGAPATTDSTPTTTEAAAPATTEEEAAESVSPDSDTTPWGWIVLVAGVAIALLGGFLLWRRRRLDADSWSRRMKDLSRRALAALDDVRADGSLATGAVQALASDAASLEGDAPDEVAGGAAARLRSGLNDLADTLEADRALRLASPPADRGAARVLDRTDPPARRPAHRRAPAAELRRAARVTASATATCGCGRAGRSAGASIPTATAVSKPTILPCS